MTDLSAFFDPSDPGPEEAPDWGSTIAAWLDDPEPLPASAPEAKLVLLPTLDLEELAKTRARPQEFAIERIAPLGEVTLFTGPGSAGKSLLAQQICTAGAAGQSCIGLAITATPTIYVTCEDKAEQLHFRQEHICEALGIPLASLAGKLHLISLRGELDNALSTVDEKGNFAPSPAFERLEATIKAAGAKIAALDNVAHLFVGNENDRGDVTQFVNLLNRLAGATGAAIILVGHPNKSGDTYSGSTAWLNAVRSQVWLDKVRDSDGNVDDRDARALTLGKANYSPDGEVARFRWHNWAFVRDEDLPSDTRAELDKVIAANGENAAFLRCLAARNTQRRQVSEKGNAQNYAPRVFAKMPEAKGLSKNRLEAAMERLFAIGAIERGFLYRDTAEGKDILGLRERSDEPSGFPESHPETSRKVLPESSGNPHKIAGNSVPIYTYIPGADAEAAAPDVDEGDGIDG